MFESIANWLANQVIDYGYAIAFAITLLENSAFIGLVVPGETTLVLVGFFAQGSELSIVWLVAAAVVGAVIGDNISYLVGRRGGRPLVRKLEKRFTFLEQRIEQSQAYFTAHGGKTVFTGRFVAFIRTVVPFTAGVARMPYGRFFVYNFLGAAIQVTALLLIGYFFGSQWQAITGYLSTAGVVLLLAFALTVYLVWRHRVSKKEKT